MRNFALVSLLWFVTLFTMLGGATAQADAGYSEVLDRIRQSGQVRIGVKTDVHPFGFMNADGQPVGFEIEMAEEIANVLGVELVKVPVRTENRFQKLELGEVDILIATVGDSLARRKLATAIEPAYFQAGVTVMLRPDFKLKDWNAIRGKTICALQGAYFNRPIAERHLLTLQTYKTVRDGLLAVKDGLCDGYLYNRPVIQRFLSQPEFADFTAPFPDVLITPWAIFVAKSEGGSKLDITLGNMVAGWYRDGFIARGAEKWGVKFGADWPGPQVELWNRKNADGTYVCKRDANGRWPAECRLKEFFTSTDVSGIEAFGLNIKEQFGIDLSYVYDHYDRWQLVTGLLNTGLITMSSIICTLLLGVLGAFVVEARIPGFSWATAAIMAVLRYNPPLLMMYLLFFGVGGILLTQYHVRIPAIVVAVFCLSIYTAGIIVSALRDAADYLRKEDPLFRLRFSNLSQAIEYSRWPIKQALINGTKMSMICSAIAVPELLSATSFIMADKGNFLVMMVTLVVLYYLITAFWIWAFNVLEDVLYQGKSKAGARSR